MTMVGRVRTLWRYPVKSMLGEDCESLELNQRGIVGDRLFAIRDQAGKLGSGKNSDRFKLITGLLDFRSHLDDDVPVVSFPDGRQFRGDDEHLDAAISEILREPLKLALEDDVPHHDDSPVHLISSASLDWLAIQLGSRVDERRFRPNLVVEIPGQTLIENDWLQRELLIGRNSRFLVKSRTTRCRMTTLAQDDLHADDRVLSELARKSQSSFGVYLEVLEAGTIRVDDPVTLLD